MVRASQRIKNWKRRTACVLPFMILLFFLLTEAMGKQQCGKRRKQSSQMSRLPQTGKVLPRRKPATRLFVEQKRRFVDFFWLENGKCRIFVAEIICFTTK